MPACKGRSGHHARPSCFPPFGGGIIKSTEHTATPWLRAKPEDQQGKSGEKPALALDFLQAVSVERVRTKGAFLPGHWETEKAYAAAQARADLAAPYSQARRPTNVLFSAQNARAEYYFNVHYTRQF